MAGCTRTHAGTAHNAAQTSALGLFGRSCTAQLKLRARQRMALQTPRCRINGNNNKDRRLRNCELSVVVCSNYIRDTNDGRWPSRTPPFALASCTCSLAIFHKRFFANTRVLSFRSPLSQRTTHSVSESLQRCSAEVVGEITHGPTTLLVPSLQ